MPAELFGDVASRKRPAGHRLGAAPISVIVHAAVICAVIVIPLMAGTILPSPPTRLAVEIPSMPVVAVPQVPRPPVQRPTLISAAPSVPVVAPSGIRDETIARPPVELTIDVPTHTGEIVGVPVLDAIPDVPLPVPPPKTTKTVRVGTVQPPVKIHHRAPVYPQAAILAQIQGTVVIEATIGIDGAVQDARVINSVPLLDGAALDAVREWRYRPTLLSGNPVAVIMTVRVEFRLNR